MNILNALQQLRDDIKTWVTNNFNALNAKIDEKTIPIDSKLSSTSTNPVQNKVIKKAIDDIPTFSGDYNDLTNAPDISEDGSGNMVIADESGNIIFKADADGIHTTAVSLNGEAAASEKYVDEAIATKVDFTGYATEEQLDNLRKEIGEGIESDAEDWKIIDEAGNIIFHVDKDGTHTTSMTLNGKEVATKEYVEGIIPEVDLTGYATEEYVDEAVANIDIPDVDFTGYATEDFVTGAIDSAKEELSESIVAESDEWKVVDEAGNIIFSVDATGAHTTELTLNGENAATESYVDEAIAQIPKPDLTDYATKKYVDDAVDGIDFTGYATETYVDTKVADLVNSAPEALNTLGELADALENHEDAYDALLETVGSKATHTDLENLKEELSESIVSEADEWKVVDNSGNIIFSVDANGAHVTDLSLNGRPIGDLIEENAGTPVDIVQTTGTSETAVMSQKAVTDAIAANVVKNVQDGQDLGVQQAPGSDIVDNTFSFIDKNPIAIDIFNQMIAAGVLPPIPLEKIPYGAVGDRSVSFNGRSASFGKRSFTNGTSTIAIGEQSHAEGDSTVTFGHGSHAEGYRTTAIGIESHAEGISTVAYGDGSHAEGDHTEAHGESSHSEGIYTKALHPVSHVSGRGTVSSRDAQTVVGTYNEDASDALFIVGNGESDTERSNAFTINEDGTATLGSSPKSDMDAVNKKYVDEALAALREELMAAIQTGVQQAAEEIITNGEW